MAARVGGCVFFLFVAGLFLLFARVSWLRPRWGSNNDTFDRLNRVQMSLASCIAGAVGFTVIGILFALQDWLLSVHLTHGIASAIFAIMGTFCVSDYWRAGKIPPP